MPTSDGFDEFEIELRSSAGGFEARVLRAPAGRASAAFFPPFIPEQVQGVLQALERRVRAGSSARLEDESEDAAEQQAQLLPCDLEELGRTLFGALFPELVERTFRESLAGLSAQPGGAHRRGLCLRVTFDRQEDLAFLGTLPWEVLLDGRQFLALHRQTPIVRSYNQRTTPLSPVSGPLRALLVESNPVGLRPLETALEIEKIRAGLERNPHIEIVHLQKPNVRLLRDALIDEGCQILHFMGHGGLSTSSEDEFVLWFEGENRKPEPVSGELLADFVKDVPDLRLVVLNSCWGAALPRRGGQDPFTGVATALMRRDIPAVVAMQFPISDAAAIAFSDVFYARLAVGDSVCAAVTEGRLEIMRRERGTVEWATPVLFLAGGDRLFEGAPTPKRRTVQRRAKTAADAPPRDHAAVRRPLVLAIRSFSGFVSEREPDHLLDLTPFFDGRQIRSHAMWQGEVFPRLRDFLLRQVAASQALVLDFAAHSTLAFAAGYCLEAKSGLDITLLQRGLRGTMLWRAEAGPSREAPVWVEGEADRRRDPGAADVAMAVSVTWPVLDDVGVYLDRAQLPVGRLIPVTLHPKPSPTGVADGLHALQLAQDLAWKIRGRSVQERAAVLHLFTAAPNSLLFFLGQLGKSLGTVQLYEHDFGDPAPGAYRPSLRLPVSPPPRLAG